MQSAKERGGWGVGVSEGGGGSQHDGNEETWRSARTVPGKPGVEVVRET